MSEVPATTGAVRERLAALVADVLPSADPVPQRLRRIAAFAPARRARLGGEAIVSVLESDDEFRARAADLVGERAHEERDPAEAAALAWLRREPGWEQIWEATTDRLAARAEEATAAREEQESAREADRADRAEEALRALRAERRRQLDELRGEVSTLRHRLGETRRRERDARQAADGATAALSAAQDDVRRAAEEGETERRRLRARVEELEAANAALRRTSREERGEIGLRARVLLDTVVEAAAGLRRELALPVADAAPGDRVERRVAEAAAEVGATAGPGAAGRDGASRLEQYLAAPRPRLLVDGYNVSKSAWPEASLEAQRARLLRSLAPLAARTGAETTVVFDAASSAARPTAVQAPRGVKVLFSPPGVIADDVIAELVETEPTGRMVVVVSSDQEVARHAARHGARAVASQVLLSLLG
ncbi:NYN domain-containing protein [Nocardioides sp. CFH 31398]|uniref:NYN domain-containing protein n=1 Tax=Nocardioides sp. CFH 31398 TaxID=2919579 RepID=UPI001F0572E3|nr:NYN domain-containing protein [Nocardioides sp. CFH 31398]MCH1868214.1 NYN domain-containing protein [Nocardioides sp. CFH 31398]